MNLLLEPKTLFSTGSHSNLLGSSRLVNVGFPLTQTSFDAKFTQMSRFPMTTTS
jgi:hypothetical protein